jgi:Fe-S-cluster-containing hydrogenase component 2
MIVVIVCIGVLILMVYLMPMLIAPLLHILQGEKLVKGEGNPMMQWFAELFSFAYTPAIRIVFYAVKSDWWWRGPFRIFLPWFLGQIITRGFYRGEIYTTEEIITLIKRVYSENQENDHFHIVVSPCICRHAEENYDETGYLPTMTCMHLQFMAKNFERNVEHSRMISAETAIALLREFSRKGLVHIMYGMCPSIPFEDLGWMWTRQIAICGCHWHCVTLKCELLRGYTGLHPFIKADHYAVVDPEKCLGIEKCGRCLKGCPFRAIETDENGKSYINRDYCYGCGVCTRTDYHYSCPGGAISLKGEPDPKRHFIHPRLLSEDLLINLDELDMENAEHGN